MILPKNCKKFEKLVFDRLDRDLSEVESMFIQDHLAQCVSCRAVDMAQSSSINMLRSAIIEPEISPQFDQSIIRKARIVRGRDSWSYWYPAALSAGIAALAVFAVMQLLGKAPVNKPIFLDGHEASNAQSPTANPKLIFPNLR